MEERSDGSHSHTFLGRCCIFKTKIDLGECDQVTAVNRIKRAEQIPRIVFQYILVERNRTCEMFWTHAKSGNLGAVCMVFSMLRLYLRLETLAPANMYDWLLELIEISGDEVQAQRCWGTPEAIREWMRLLDIPPLTSSEGRELCEEDLAMRFALHHANIPHRGVQVQMGLANAALNANTEPSGAAAARQGGIDAQPAERGPYADPNSGGGVPPNRILEDQAGAKRLEDFLVDTLGFIPPEDTAMEEVISQTVTS